VIVALLFLLLAATPTFEETFRAGLLSLQRNDLRAAEENLGAAAKLAPENPRVWVALARTFWKLNEGEKAADAAVKAQKFGATDALVLSSLAIFYADSGQTLKAAEAQAQFASLAPNDAAAREKAQTLYFEATEPLLQQQKFTEALGILNKAAAQLPGSAQLELARGVANYALRRFDDAADAFLRTIAIDPELERPYLFLGRFLGQIPDRLTQVSEQFIRFEKAHPGTATGYLLHAKVLNAQLGDPAAARKLLEQSIALEEASAPAHFELGVVLDRMQQYAEAAREFARAAELDPADSATHYRLSRLYDRLGKPADARKHREIHAKLVEAQEAAR
jgi:tetratricopeptide (TPR) repeat protein